MAEDGAVLEALLGWPNLAVVGIDPAGRVSRWSAGASLLFGWTAAEVVGRPFEVLAPDGQSEALAALRTTAEQGVEQPDVRTLCVARDGTRRVLNLQLLAVRDGADQVIGALAVYRQPVPVHDDLTGLVTRTLLLDRARQALLGERRSSAQTGLVVLGVVDTGDAAHQVGDTGGDVVLREIAVRLQTAVRPADSVGRIGSEVFGILIQDVPSLEDLRARVATLLEVADEPVLVDGVAVQVQLRAASAVSPAADAESLLAAAERSLGVRSEEAPGATADDEQTCELRRAIAAGQLRLHYQPVIDLATDGITGAEALVRWQHPTRGLLPPPEFMPLAERSGLVVELGEWVLREACVDLVAWTQGGRDWSVGVNLSPRQIVGTDLPGTVRRVLAQTGADPGRLVIEVTESTLTAHPAAHEVLNSLRLLGVRLALDDFGTGYSSMTYLRRFAVDSIKIDRSFVAGIGRDSDDDAIVTSIVSLAGAVGKRVVAEGVETAGQLQALRGLGVDYAQGFLWTPPLPLEQLDHWMADRPRLRSTSADSPLGALPDMSRVVTDADQGRILELHLEGASLHTVAAAMNAEGRRTPAGPRWTTTTVARVVAELARAGLAMQTADGQRGRDGRDR